MKHCLKRIRGAVGLGLTWAAAWFGVGAIIGLVTGIFNAAWGTSTGSLIMTFLSPTILGLVFGSALFGSVVFAMCGFAGGAAFSVILAVTEGHRRFDEMSLPRFAAWGAVGAFLLAMPLLLPLLLLLAATDPPVLYWFGTSAVVALLGAGSAAGSLALARRADDRELLDSGLRPSVLPVDLRRREGQGKPVPPGEDLQRSLRLDLVA